MLKRLEDALADGDTIHAVIRARPINNDGAAKVGYTAPSVDGQAGVIDEALAVAAAEPETIGYVEAHGTGTALGDPIEIAALTQAFRAGTDAEGFCAIGSVKTNIGHLDAAAGVAGLIKTVLALEHGADSAEPALRAAQPEHRFRGQPLLRQHEAVALGVGRHAAPRGRQLASASAAPTPTSCSKKRPQARTFDSTEHMQLVIALSPDAGRARRERPANLAAHLKRHPDTQPRPTSPSRSQSGAA